MRFQLLWHDVTVEDRTGEPEVAALLELAAQDAEHTFAPTATAELSVAARQGGFEVRDRDDRLAVVDTPRAVLDTVFARVHRRAFELAALAGWVRVHGTVLQVGGARFVLVGESGAGKTTLAVAALAAGHLAEGDESFLVRSGQVVAVPRRFHVKPGTEAHVPGAAAWLAAAPVLDGDPPLRLLSPTAVGRRWPLPVAPAEHVVVLERTGGPSALGPASAAAVAPLVVAQAFPTVEPRRRVVQEVAGLLRDVQVHALGVGPDGSALTRLEDVARGPSAE